MIFNHDPEVMKVLKQTTSQFNTSTFSKSTSRTNTKVPAIMFTDVVGYTRMIEADQEVALDLLEKNRKLHQYNIDQLGGTWIKEMGDGIMVSFSSASTAVECAMNIQKACKNVPGLQLRIGIHFGEVVFTKNDMLGIVVNIASRLQCLAKPGQILVSAAVAKCINEESNYQVNLVGHRRLKNVKQPVQVHRIGELNESERLTWWLVYSQFPLQKVVTVTLMISSMFRF